MASALWDRSCFKIVTKDKVGVSTKNQAIIQQIKAIIGCTYGKKKRFKATLNLINFFIINIFFG
jgi:hypothetical protein